MTRQRENQGPVQAERTLAKLDREDWQKESVGATLRFVLGTFYFAFLFGLSPVLVSKFGWTRGLLLIGAGFLSAEAFHRRLLKRMRGLRDRAGAEPWALPGQKTESADLSVHRGGGKGSREGRAAQEALGDADG